MSSCKKDRQVKPENLLIGSWKETNIDRSVSFTADNRFSLLVKYSDGGSSTFSGTYQVKSDSLKVTTQEIVEQKPGKPVERFSHNYPLYEKATFSVKNDSLTVNYLTYPADGPVPTTAKFSRIIPIPID